MPMKTAMVYAPGTRPAGCQPRGLPVWQGAAPLAVPFQCPCRHHGQNWARGGDNQSTPGPKVQFHLEMGPGFVGQSSADGVTGAGEIPGAEDQAERGE